MEDIDTLDELQHGEDTLPVGQRKLSRIGTQRTLALLTEVNLVQ